MLKQCSIQHGHSATTIPKLPRNISNN